MEQRIEQPPAFPVSTMVKLVIGSFLIVLGLLLTLDTLDIVYADGYLRYWPLVLLVIGALKVAGRDGAVFGIVLMIAGAWMTAFNLGWIGFTIFDLWPLLLIGFGVTMVARAFGWSMPRPATSSLAILSSRNLVETSQEFSRWSGFASFGSWRVDLTRARFAGGKAVIDATAFLGGIEIIVGDDCEVIGEVVPFMGGFEIKSHPSGSHAGGQLVVRGMVVMGGIEVKSVGRIA